MVYKSNLRLGIYGINNKNNNSCFIVVLSSRGKLFIELACSNDNTNLLNESCSLKKKNSNWNDNEENNVVATRKQCTVEVSSKLNIESMNLFSS